MWNARDVKAPEEDWRIFGHSRFRCRLASSVSFLYKPAKAVLPLFGNRFVTAAGSRPYCSKTRIASRWRDIVASDHVLEAYKLLSAACSEHGHLAWPTRCHTAGLSES